VIEILVFFRVKRPIASKGLWVGLSSLPEASNSLDLKRLEKKIIKGVDL
jgi:hypothetical protein